MDDPRVTDNVVRIATNAYLEKTVPAAITFALAVERANTAAPLA